jgi:hypothetical protein
VNENINRGRTLASTSALCRCNQEIFDPAPSLKNYRFGKAQEFNWHDRNGLVWRGGLILPTDYKPGRRYPLIVQTHGFNAPEFLLDGPSGITTAFAAQTFANAGFVVLQISDNPKAFTLDGREGGLVAEGYRSAIGQAVALGYADSKRVGLIAFSHTGYDAIQLIATYPKLLAAVDISDALQPGYLQDLIMTNYPADVRDQLISLNGAATGTPSYGKWFERSPLYRIAHFTGATRIEAIGRLSLVAMWETYAVLRNAGRVVDLVYFPWGEHVLQKPSERMGSQDGNVDWFRFWLQGYEDPDPKKRPQYQRWQAMRGQKL